MSDKIYQNDNGTVFNFTVKSKGAVQDITGATVNIVFKTATRRLVKPAIITDGINGKCSVTTTSEDLAESGFYTMQGVVTFTGGSNFASDSHRELIHPRI